MFQEQGQRSGTCTLPSKGFERMQMDNYLTKNFLIVSPEFELSILSHYHCLHDYVPVRFENTSYSCSDHYITLLASGIAIPPADTVSRPILLSLVTDVLYGPLLYAPTPTQRHASSYFVLDPFYAVFKKQYHTQVRTPEGRNQDKIRPTNYQCVYQYKI